MFMIVNVDSNDYVGEYTLHRVTHKIRDTLPTFTEGRKNEDYTDVHWRWSIDFY